MEKNVAETKQNNKSSRMTNLELLRCVAMMMVVVLHYLGKGSILSNLLGEKLENAEIVAWIMESFCIVAVNAYMFISGYFLCTSTFKLSRLIKLYLQLWVYSAGIGVFGILAGISPMQQGIDLHDLLTFFFPVSMGHYWFITAYIFMYIFLPFIGSAVQRMTKKQMQLALGVLLFFFCIVKSVLPVRLEMDGQGYDFAWYLCAFLTAAYIRKFGCSLISNMKKSVCLYVIPCLLNFVFTLGLHQVYIRTGALGYILKISMEYNHILPYLASIGLLGIFLHVKVPEKMGHVVTRIAPYTLGVYLLHENIIWRYEWPDWLGAYRVDSVAGLLRWTLLAIVVIYTLGILVDMLRTFVMKRLHALFSNLKIYRKLLTAIENADRVFAGEEKQNAQ